MTKYDAFTMGFFLWMREYFKEDTAFVRPRDLATKYGIPKTHVEEKLVQWAEEKLIWLGAWDGTRERPWNEWPPVRNVFRAGSDGGSVRVRLLADGGHFAEKLKEQVEPETPPPKIGFTAS
jgi:hypothetical protein